MPRASAIPVILALLAAPAGAEEPLITPAPVAAPARDAILEMATPFHETAVKRFENVFFISLPFSALYASLITTAAGYAIEGRRFRLDTPYLAVSMSLSVAVSALIAAKDSRERMPLPAAPTALPPAPALSGTTNEGSSLNGSSDSAGTTVPGGNGPSATVLR